MMTKDSKLEQLIEYVKKGWYIFPLYGTKDGECLCGESPCRYQGEHPMSPISVQDATTDLDQIVEWHNNYPNAYWAVATGARSGFVIVFIDPDVLCNLIISEGPLPNTPNLRHGEGGYFFFFSYPDSKVNSVNGGEAKWIGILLTDGGYAILPPCIDKWGGEYRWGDNSLDENPAPMPDWLVEQYNNGDGLPKTSHVIEFLDDGDVELHY